MTGTLVKGENGQMEEGKGGRGIFSFRDNRRHWAQLSIPAGISGTEARYG
jgi:hypothetical protein